MTDTSGNTETTGAGTKSILGIAAVACVACCIGPILGVLGAIAALGLLSTILIGVAGLLVSAAAIAVLVIVRRRRITPSCTLVAAWCPSNNTTAMQCYASCDPACGWVASAGVGETSSGAGRRRR